VALNGKIREVSIAEAKPTDLLSPHEVAELCGMTYGRVCQLLQSEEMKGHKLRGVLWQVELREAQKFMKQGDGPGRPRNG
jgi:hypothetical protein